MQSHERNLQKVFYFYSHVAYYMDMDNRKIYYQNNCAFFYFGTVVTSDLISLSYQSKKDDPLLLQCQVLRAILIRCHVFLEANTPN